MIDSKLTLYEYMIEAPKLLALAIRNDDIVQRILSYGNRDKDEINGEEGCDTNNDSIVWFIESKAFMLILMLHHTFSS